MTFELPLQQPWPMKGYLINLGWTLSALAPITGYSLEHMSSMLNRKRPVSRGFVEALKHVTGLDEDEMPMFLGPAAAWVTPKNHEAAA